MNPRLILAAIEGGMTGVFTLTVFYAGLVSPASPGSIFAVQLMTNKGSILGGVCSIFAAAAVSFTVAALLLKAQTSTEQDVDKDALVKATSKMQEMKAGSKVNRHRRRPKAKKSTWLMYKALLSLVMREKALVPWVPACCVKKFRKSVCPLR